jgi:hypothetical protein
MPIYIAFKELLSCDIVDEGALTTTLFSSENELLNRFNDIIAQPQFQKVLEKNYRAFTKLNEFYSNLYKEPIGFFSKLKKFIGLESKTNDPDDTTDIFPIQNNEIDMTKEELNALLEERETKLKTEFTTQLEGLKSDLQSEKEETSSLKEQLKEAKDKITQLESAPAEDHANGQKDTTSAKKGLGPAHAELKAKYKLP